MYKILESRIEFKDNKLHKVTVLVDFTSSTCKPYTDVRAYCGTTAPANGYMSIGSNAKLNEDLLQEVAGYGSRVSDRDKIFPKWKSKL